MAEIHERHVVFALDRSIALILIYPADLAVLVDFAQNLDQEANEKLSAYKPSWPYFQG